MSESDFYPPRDEVLIVEAPLGESEGGVAVSDAFVPLWRQRLRIFLQNKLAIASVVYLVLIVLFCFLGPLLWHSNQTDQAQALLAPQNGPPSAHDWLGTDPSGYDELGRIKFADSQPYTFPIVSGKRIFIKDQDKLTLWMLD